MEAVSHIAIDAPVFYPLDTDPDESLPHEAAPENEQGPRLRASAGFVQGIKLN
jgi:hypothetical protein